MTDRQTTEDRIDEFLTRARRAVGNVARRATGRKKMMHMDIAKPKRKRTLGRRRAV